MNGKLKTALIGFAAALMLGLAPASALAGEPVLDPVGADITFAGGGGSARLNTVWMGNIGCVSVDASGTIGSSGKSGTMTLDMTGCSVTYLGFTYPCQSFPGSLSNTIKLAGTFETTYLTDAKTKPGIKFNIAVTRIGCSYGAPPPTLVTMSGSVLATLPTPACGVESNKGTIDFAGDQQITGTGPSITLMSTNAVETEQAPGGLFSDLSVEFSKAIKVTCV